MKADEPATNLSMIWVLYKPHSFLIFSPVDHLVTVVAVVPVVAEVVSVVVGVTVVVLVVD